MYARLAGLNERDLLSPTWSSGSIGELESIVWDYLFGEMIWGDRDGVSWK